MWARARSANYHGRVKEWPAVKYENGKFYASTIQDGMTVVPFDYNVMTPEFLLSERKVIKVGNSEPEIPEAPMVEPQMDNEIPMEEPMDNEEPEMNGDMPMDNNGGEENFDRDFDAGIDVDEDADPKKYIQKLTGKLSQKLRDYTENNGEPDAELNKYVAGMVVKQAVDGLNAEDKGDIIKKINSESEIDEPDVENDETSEMDEPMANEEPNMETEMPMECKFTKKQLLNLKESLGNSDENSLRDEKRIEKKINSDIKQNRKNKPFFAPKFE